MKTDVIVIGAGHAGIEAANISAKLKLNTILITQEIDKIAKLSCNPAIGGIGKSQLVMEIDLLGGLMAKLADKARLLSKVLNTSKGKAVRATRIQVDKNLYSQTAIIALNKLPYLTILQQNVIKLIINNNTVKGVLTSMGITITAKTVIMTTGTFMGCNTYVGEIKTAYARDNEFNRSELANTLKYKLKGINSFKTGTPPRIAQQSINTDILKEIKQDKPEPFFNKLIKKPTTAVCWETNTNNTTKHLITNNITKSAAYSKLIEAQGPRYCLSIEDKIIRFPNYDTHTLFLELENTITQEIYIGGLATSFDYKTQKQIVKSIEGLEHAKITRFGYGITYKFFNPKHLKINLESKTIKNLFLAGQINGTSGYEEAAAQGIIAGINAYNAINDNQPLILKPTKSYIGILIKDITQNGVTEPYRMFTSRAKNRLIMRSDNLLFRLKKPLLTQGLITHQQYLKIHTIFKTCCDFIKFAQHVLIRFKHTKQTLYKLLLKYPLKTISNLIAFKQAIKKFRKPINQKMLNYIESEIKYKGYYHNNKHKVNTTLHIDIKNIKNLANETKEQIQAHNFNTLKQIKTLNIRSACIENIKNYIRTKTKPKTQQSDKLLLHLKHNENKNTK